MGERLLGIVVDQPARGHQVPCHGLGDRSGQRAQLGAYLAVEIAGIDLLGYGNVRPAAGCTVGARLGRLAVAIRGRPVSEASWAVVAAALAVVPARLPVVAARLPVVAARLPVVAARLPVVAARLPVVAAGPTVVATAITLVAARSAPVSPRLVAIASLWSSGSVLPPVRLRAI
jgi:hypothetical protein